MVSGFFLGGAGAGAETARTRREQAARQEAQTALQQRGLDIREAEIGRQAERQARADASQAVERTVTLAQGIVDKAVESRDPNAIRRAVNVSNQLIDSAGTPAAVAGVDLAPFRTAIAERAVIPRPPTEAEQFAATLRGLPAAGAPTTQEAAATPAVTPTQAQTAVTGAPAPAAVTPATAGTVQPSPRSVQAALALAEAGDVAGARKVIQDDIKAQTATRSTQEMFQAEQGLRKEYLQQSRNFVEVRNAFNRAQSIGNTAVGDVALIFAFMKSIDPRSTVREGEAATVEQARGVPATILNLYNRAVRGNRLNDTQRSEIKREVANAFRPMRAAQTRRRNFYQSLAERGGLAAENVAPDLSGDWRVTPSGLVVRINP